MNDKPLISIAIPTYNRAVYLENLLNHIAPQAKESGGIVQICISNNCSTDNTHKVVMDFKEKYPGLINYNANEKNLGFDINMLKVIEMAQGDFVWPLGDDDLVVDGGFKKVIDFIDNYCDENTGLIMLGNKSYFVDSKTGKEVVYFDTAEKDKPRIYKINLKDIIGIRFSNSYLSVLLFNNNFLKRILEEEREIIEKSVGGLYIHTFLYQLMLLKYPKLEIIKLNEIIITDDSHYHKIYIEDKFTIFYASWKKLNDLLLHSKYTGDFYKKIIISEQKELRKSIIKEMGIMKAFGAFDYFSFFGCMKLFFQKAVLPDALLFSAFFVIFFIIPPFILRNLYKTFIKIKHKKNWQKVWLHIAGSWKSVSFEDYNIN
ncbi:MAG: glycosyltransferase family 2 protein [Candidatus Staskawiczbacteria bacterium]|jgi:glycosyltransferase involved in cell wall biosynthesis